MESQYDAKSTSNKAWSSDTKTTMGKPRNLTIQRVVCTLARLQIQFPGGVPLRDLLTELSERYHVKNTGDRIKSEVRRLLNIPIRLGFVSKAGSWYRVTRAPRQLARRSSRTWRSLRAMLRQYEAQLQRAEKVAAPPVLMPLPPKEYADRPGGAATTAGGGSVLNWASGETAMPATPFTSLSPPLSAPTSQSQMSSPRSACASATGPRRRVLQCRGRDVPFELAYAAAAAAVSRHGARQQSVKLEGGDSISVTPRRENGPDRAWTAIIHTHSGQKVVQIVPPDSASKAAAALAAASRAQAEASAQMVAQRGGSSKGHRSVIIQARPTPSQNSARSGRSARSSKPPSARPSTSAAAAAAAAAGSRTPLGGVRRFPLARASLSSFGRRSLSLSSSSDRPRVYKPTRQDVLNSQRRRIRARLQEERREIARQDALRRRELERRYADRRRHRGAYWRAACPAKSAAVIATPAAANTPAPSASLPVAVAAVQRAVSDIRSRSFVHDEGGVRPHPCVPATAPASRRPSLSRACPAPANRARDRSTHRKRAELPRGGGGAAESKSAGVTSTRRPAARRPRSRARSRVHSRVRSRVRSRARSRTGPRTMDASDLERLLPPSVLGLMRELSPPPVTAACTPPRVPAAPTAPKERGSGKTQQPSSPQQAQVEGGAGKGRGAGVRRPSKSQSSPQRSDAFVIRVSPKRQAGDKSQTSTPSQNASPNALRSWSPPSNAQTASAPKKSSRAVTAKIGDTKLAEAMAWESPHPHPTDGDAEDKPGAQKPRTIYVGKPLPRHRSTTTGTKCTTNADRLPDKPKLRIAHSVGIFKKESPDMLRNSPSRRTAVGRPPLGRSAEGKTPKAKEQPGAPQNPVVPTTVNPLSKGDGSNNEPSRQRFSNSNTATRPREGTKVDAASHEAETRTSTAKGASSHVSPDLANARPPGVGPPQGEAKQAESADKATEQRKKNPRPVQPMGVPHQSRAQTCDAGTSRSPSTEPPSTHTANEICVVGNVTNTGSRVRLSRPRNYPRPWAIRSAGNNSSGCMISETGKPPDAVKNDTTVHDGLTDAESQTEPIPALSQSTLQLISTATQMSGNSSLGAAERAKSTPATKAVTSKPRAPKIIAALPLASPSQSPGKEVLRNTGTQTGKRTKYASGRRRFTVPTVVNDQCPESAVPGEAQGDEVDISQSAATTSVTVSAASTSAASVKRPKTPASPRRFWRRSAPPTPAEISEAETSGAPPPPPPPPPPPAAATPAGTPAGTLRRLLRFGKSTHDVPLQSRRTRGKLSPPAWVGAGGEHSPGRSSVTAVVAAAAAAAAQRLPATRRMTRRSVLTASAVAPEDVRNGQLTPPVQTQIWETKRPKTPMGGRVLGATASQQNAALRRPPSRNGGKRSVEETTLRRPMCR